MKKALTPFPVFDASKQLLFRSPPGYPACSTNRTLVDKTLGLWKASRMIDHSDFQRTTVRGRLGAVGFELRSLRCPGEIIKFPRQTEHKALQGIFLCLPNEKYTAQDRAMSARAA